MKFEMKMEYGTQRFYPMCDKAKALGNLAGRKSFYADNIVDIRDKLCIDVQVFIHSMGGYMKVELDNQQ